MQSHGFHARFSLRWCNRSKTAGAFKLEPSLTPVPTWPPISKSQSECYISICTWFTRSKMGNVLAASPSNPSSSSNVASMPPPPPITAAPPVDAKPQPAENQTTNNPGTYEDLHKSCKGTLMLTWTRTSFTGFPILACVWILLWCYSL